MRKTVGLAAILGLFLGQSALGADTRVIIIKVDGLSPLVLDGAVDPSDPAVDRLPHSESFREAHAYLRSVTKRDRLVPNIEAYFYRAGVRTSMYCATLPLSTPSWAVIDTGQPSIVKSNSYFNRFSGSLKSYLDQLRESYAVAVKGSPRTTALWQLDILGVPLLADYFPEGHAWTAIQPLYRLRPTDQLTSVGKYLATAGERGRNPLRLLQRHLANSAYGADYPERHDHALALLTSRKILETDLEGNEKHDFLSVFFSALDHQFHVDPNYENILSWLTRIDGWIGEILAAVEQSQRRDSTLVVLLSDHGLDFNPVQLNYSFPINPWLRERQFGGHTVLAPVVEDTEHALTVPIRGIDFPRIYESPESSFGTGVPFGEKGFPTAYTDNTGNPRFDAYLRNSDLNRLHLLMLEVLRCRKQPDLLDRIFPEFNAAFAAVKTWLGDEIQEGVQAAAGLREIAKKQAVDPDAVKRFTEESTGYDRVAEALSRLAALPSEKQDWLKWASREFRIAELIPKGYFGPNNTLQQLRNYVTGWETPPEDRWTKPTTYRTVDYTKLFPSVKATSGNASGKVHPFHFFSAAVPVELLSAQVDRPLQQAIWLVFLSSEALILESTEGEILYRPIQSLEFVDNAIRLNPLADPASDQLGYATLAERWMPRRSWLEKSGGTMEWKLVPLILTDLFRDNFRLVGRLGDTDGDEARAREFHFSRQIPDFRVWTFRGWNVNSNSHTPGGSHGNFTELDVRTVFAVWGGKTFPLQRGQFVPGAFQTSDIVPTVLSIMNETSQLAHSWEKNKWAGEVIPTKIQKTGQQRVDAVQ